MRLRHLAAAALASVVALPVSSALAQSGAAITKASASTLSLGNPLGDLITALMSADLQRAVTVNGIRQHLAALQRIADAHDGNRAAGTSGSIATVNYLKQRLQRAGYRVTVQNFDIPFYQELNPGTFAELTPTPKTFVDLTDFTTMPFSGSGDVTGRLVPTNDIEIPPAPAPNSTSGCEPADFPAAVSGQIALVQRGTCDFSVKAANAKAAGAKAVVIFNEGQPGRTDLYPTAAMDVPIDIPVLKATFDVGADLYAQTQAGPVTVHITTDTLSEIRPTSNVIGETWFGRPDTVVVVGAHLDSVQAGPGINDNGSGTAANLEVAEQLGRRQLLLRNKVRFIFFGAEELGLLGSEHYVASLSDTERAKIKAMLNFDMVGSPNYVRFVYDGNGSDTPDPGPNGSGLIENVFLAHFAQKNLATAPTAFDGRSDYGPFIDAGIPAGGLFSGAEGIKTAAEARIYGGTAGQPYDSCYHEVCDTIANISNAALDQFSDAIANSVVVFAQRRDPVVDPAGPAASAAKRIARTATKGALYKGPLMIR
ncbi:M20/M25/M40 family metallo-hydrolase [Inquilinus sp. Marseille-Q2685]|uniref:M20/M25/M40 family metallo-hydrolase n=1 Tax=Inquilinus sp. Marseille-Q2685 TaxID=2866581 RepID=UPI001CE47D49|nr:M20/M25/M40 family metallo-hydrolase [Inquilinus sp. Marseille-Q2685]